MKLEKQLTSLEISRRLQKLGVKQKSIFWWYENELLYSPHEMPKFSTGDARTVGGGRVITHPQKTISAFTVSELGEMLGREDASPHLIKAYGHVFCVPDTRFVTVRGLQLAMQNPDLGGKMLIYLLENGLIK